MTYKWQSKHATLLLQSTLYRFHLFCARQIPPTPYHPVSLRSTSVVSYLFLPRLSKWSLSFRFTHQNHVYIYLLSTVYHMFCQSHHLVLIIQVMYVDDHSLLNLSFAIFSFVLKLPISYSKISSLAPSSGTHTFLSSLFFNALTFCTSINVKDKVSHRQQTNLSSCLY